MSKPTASVSTLRTPQYVPGVPCTMPKLTVYRDEGMSESKGQEQHPGLEAALTHHWLRGSHGALQLVDHTWSPATRVICSHRDDNHASGRAACILVTTSSEPLQTTKHEGKGATCSAFPNFSLPLRHNTLAAPAMSR
jgi:hypothetical protein